MIRHILSVIFPKNCLMCSRLTKIHDFCDECKKQMVLIGNPQCLVCGIPFKGETHNHECSHCQKVKPPFNNHHSLFYYQGIIPQLIYKIKYDNRHEFFPVLADFMIQHIQNCDVIIPVPVTLTRLRKRTYNQSLELALHISKKTGTTCLTHFLQKRKHVKPQTGLNRKDRLTNLKNAFVLKGENELITNKNVLLIDDVYSTGSTIFYASKKLKKLKPKSIKALTIAMNVL